MTQLSMGGRDAAAPILDAVRSLVVGLGRAPRLEVVHAGEDPASVSYVKSIQKSAAKVGITVTARSLPATATFDEFSAAVDAAGRDPAIDAVQVQKPVPSGRALDEVIALLPAGKDVEGLHPINYGRLALGKPGPAPCTAAAVVALLDHYRIPIRGRRAVIIGRSDIVGKPLSLMLVARDATVTVCHTKTEDLPAEIGRGDLVVAAAGKPELVRGEWIKDGAVVVDVGHHVLADGRTAGDVATGSAPHAAALSPVPGGVGPVTTALLLRAIATAASGR